jgi:hypothetical protein
MYRMVQKCLICSFARGIEMEHAEQTYITGHPLLSIPNPHKDDHPGLAQFTTGSIIPMLRFYSLVYRVFMLMAFALICISRPMVKLIRLHGWDSPAYVRKKFGKPNWQYRMHAETMEERIYRVLTWIETTY